MLHWDQSTTRLYSFWTFFQTFFSKGADAYVWWSLPSLTHRHKKLEVYFLWHNPKELLRRFYVLKCKREACCNCCLVGSDLEGGQRWCVGDPGWRNVLCDDTGVDMSHCGRPVSNLTFPNPGLSRQIFFMLQVDLQKKTKLKTPKRFPVRHRVSDLWLRTCVWRRFPRRLPGTSRHLMIR